MLFIVLSILDIIAGASLYSPFVSSLFAGVLVAIAVITLGKGIWTLFTMIISGYPFHAWSGILDAIAGVALILVAYNFMSAAHILGGAVMLKGGWYLTRSILKF